MDTGVVKVIARFFLAGLVNTGLTYALYLLLLQVLDYRIAYAFSFVSGIALALVLNSKFVFQTRLTLKKGAGVSAAYCFQLIVGIFTLQLLVEHTTVGKALASLWIMVLTVPLSFFLNRYAIRRL